MFAIQGAVLELDQGDDMMINLHHRPSFEGRGWGPKSWKDVEFSRGRSFWVRVQRVIHRGVTAQGAWGSFWAPGHSRASVLIFNLTKKNPMNSNEKWRPFSRLLRPSPLSSLILQRLFQLFSIHCDSSSSNHLIVPFLHPKSLEHLLESLPSPSMNFHRDLSCVVYHKIKTKKKQTRTYTST